jgi:maleate isomerase
MLTPSSNTVLEPVTSAIFAQFGDAASVHFARFRVVEISASERSTSQFDPFQILEAAERLAEARVDCIAWNGTAASWLGLDRDRDLCARIEERTGIAATSTMLAYDAYFRDRGVTRIGLVSPYLTEIQERIIANYGAQGIEVVADRRLEDPGNFSYAEYSPGTIAGLVREVAAARPEAVIVLCTNFRGAPVAEALEADLDIPVIDSVAITAAATLGQVGLDRTRVEGYGSVFR